MLKTKLLLPFVVLISFLGCYHLDSGRECNFLVAAVAGYEKECVLPSGDVYHCYTEYPSDGGTNLAAVLFYVVHPQKLANHIFRVRYCHGENQGAPIKYMPGTAYEFKYAEKPKNAKNRLTAERLSGKSITKGDLMPVEWSDNKKMSVYGKVGLREYLSKVEVEEDLVKLELEHQMLVGTMRQAESNMASGVKLAIPDEDKGRHKLPPKRVYLYIKRVRLPKNERKQQNLAEILRTLAANESDDTGDVP